MGCNHARDGVAFILCGAQLKIVSYMYVLNKIVKDREVLIAKSPIWQKFEQQYQYKWSGTTAPFDVAPKDNKQMSD